MCLNGLRMGSAWAPYGLSMGSAYAPHGLRMGSHGPSKQNGWHQPGLVEAGLEPPRTPVHQKNHTHCAGAYRSDLLAAQLFRVKLTWWVRFGVNKYVLNRRTHGSKVSNIHLMFCWQMDELDLPPLQ